VTWIPRLVIAGSYGVEHGADSVFPGGPGWLRSKVIGEWFVFAFSQTWGYYSIISDKKQLENL